MDVPSCQDLTKSSINAILALRNPNGSTAEEIADEIFVQCVDANPDEFFQSDVARALFLGARQGIFRRVTRGGESSQLAYLINGSMALMNPINAVYVKCLCDFYTQKASRRRAPAKQIFTCSDGRQPTVSRDGISDYRPVPAPCSTCPQGCFSNSY